MSSRPPSSDDVWPVDAEGWFARLRAGEPSDSTWAAFIAWLGGDPHNPGDWEQITAIWSGLDQLGTSPAMLTLRESAHGRTLIRQRLRFGAMAAGGAFALLLAGLTLQTLGILPWSRSQAFSETASGISTTLRSHIGQRSRVLLSDGTTVLLDADSAIRIAYHPGLRDVTLLRGRARFDVARDISRPFSVRANGRIITALGTSFDVNISALSVQVGLIHGKVLVAERSRTGNRSVKLNAGEFLDAPAGAWKIQNLSGDDMTAWTKGILIFQDRRMVDIVDEINRYARAPIILDPSLRDRRMSAVLHAGDVKTFIAGIRAFKIARVTEGGRGQIIFAQ